MSRNISKPFNMTLSLINIEPLSPKYKCFYGEDVQLLISVVDEYNIPVNLLGMVVRVHYINQGSDLRQDDDITITDAMQGKIRVIVKRNYLRLGTNDIRVILYDEDQEVYLQPATIICRDAEITEVHPEPEDPPFDYKTEIYKLKARTTTNENNIGPMEDVKVGSNLVEGVNSLSTSVNTLSSNVIANTIDIVNLKKDIGTTANIQTLKDANNTATVKIAELNNKITAIGDISSTIQNVEDGKKDFNGVTHDTLKESMDANVGNILDKINNATLVPYEDKYITANNSFNGLTKNLKIKGATMINLINQYSKHTAPDAYTTIRSSIYRLKNNTKYTMYVTNKSTNLYKFYANENCFSTGGQSFDVNPGATVVRSLTTLSTYNNSLAESSILSILKNMVQQPASVNIDCVLLEGEYTEPTIDYFEGVRSVGQLNNKVDILSVGKNLLNINEFQPVSTPDSQLSMVDGKIVMKGLKGDVGEAVSISNLRVYLQKGRKYSFSYKSDAPSLGSGDTVEIYAIKDRKYDFIINIRETLNGFTCLSSGYYYFRFDVNKGNATHTFWDIQVEEGPMVTPLKDNEQDKISVSLTEPLRALDSSTYDEADIQNGKEIHRIGRKVLDWTLNWVSDYPLTNTIRFYISLSSIDNIKPSTNVLCDRFSNASIDELIYSDIEAIGLSGSTLSIRILKSRLSTTDPSGFKTWLQNNVTVIYHVLATPKETSLVSKNSLITMNEITHLYPEYNIVDPIISTKIPSDVISLTDLRQSTVKSKIFANADARVEEIEQDIKNIVTPEAWITPTLLNGWANYAGATSNPISYYKDSSGIVRLQGVANSGTAATTIFVLPSSYRPKSNKYFLCSCTGINVGRIDIGVTGMVHVFAFTGWISLDNISFRAEQ